MGSLFVLCTKKISQSLSKSNNSNPSNTYRFLTYTHTHTYSFTYSTVFLLLMEFTSMEPKQHDLQARNGKSERYLASL
ncbi:hypothetical protein HanHA300_Chr01g0034401 [Helianthus annuus]|nr:hypothetical protein HanHA300_Chr01g0034401 [Helianthus annuus]KAJ0628478.1 hypothetical protein HanHA89_Chr01g0037011 [Helianthus annuus]KAJ0784761.1 hypothetical protein HanLR1_Chr01g0035471 [Helianthus annuus]